MNIEGVFQHMHRACLQRLETYWFKGIKKTPVQPLPDQLANQTETLVNTRDREYRIERISSGKSQNKTNKQTKTELGAGGRF